MDILYRGGYLKAIMFWRKTENMVNSVRFHEIVFENVMSLFVFSNAVLYQLCLCNGNGILSFLMSLMSFIMLNCDLLSFTIA